MPTDVHQSTCYPHGERTPDAALLPTAHGHRGLGWAGRFSVCQEAPTWTRTGVLGAQTTVVVQTLHQSMRGSSSSNCQQMLVPPKHGCEAPVVPNHCSFNNKSVRCRGSSRQVCVRACTSTWVNLSRLAKNVVAP